MIDAEQVEQALMDAGFVPFTQRGEIGYGGYQIATENGDTVVTHVPGFIGEPKPELSREVISIQISAMERALSRPYKVIQFIPYEGIGYRLTVLPKNPCGCTGWGDGCPNPSACGTPNGCHCGAY